MCCKKITFALLLSLAAGCSLEKAPECAKGQIACDKKSSQLVLCSDHAGEWADRLACPDSCNDQGTTCAQTYEKCDYSGSRCADSANHDTQISMICHEGTLFPRICLNGCDPATGKCTDDASCQENEKICIELDDPVHAAIQAECHNGNWLSKYCNAGMTCNGDSCNCTDGTKVCNDSVNGGVEEICSDGKWGMTSKSCDGLSCDGDHCGECTNGDTRCVDKDGHGYIEKCTAGRWVEDEPCENGVICGSAGSCGECRQDEHKCLNDDITHLGNIYTCQMGHWQISPCPNVNCNEEGTDCGSCMSGTIKCENNGDGSGNALIYSCEPDGNWHVVHACGQNNSCNEAKTDCGNCRNDDTRCIHDEQMKGIMQICTNGVWQKQSECGDISCNQDYSGCGECLNDQIKGCNNKENTGYLNKCVKGRYTEVICRGGYSCNTSQTDCGSCVNGNKRCTNISEIGAIQTCTNGEWLTTVNCETTSCKGGDCGDCKNGDVYCCYCGSGGWLHRCIGGKYNICSRDSTTTQCPSGQNCYESGSACH